MRKRRKNLIKKAQYRVQVLCIVYSLDEPGVKVWPSDGPEAQQVLARWQPMADWKHGGGGVEDSATTASNSRLGLVEKRSAGAKMKRMADSVRDL
ncbi:hypothetical protein LINPERPRIM_LOCUS7899 [Linum perenne]